MKNEIRNFYDLEAWKRSHKISLKIYKLTEKFPKEEIYGITSQLRRSASSVGANIAEGFARFHYRDKIRFYYHARGSVAESQNFLLLAKDLRYINMENCEMLGKDFNEIAKLINGLIRSIEENIK